MRKFRKLKSGPSAEEQAWADAEQRAIMARMAAERAPAEEAEAKARAAKIERARAATDSQRHVAATLADISERLDKIERHLGIK